MAVRRDLRWTGATKFTSLNTRNAPDLVKDTELTDISNMDFYELGALRKIRGNQVSNFIISSDTFERVVLEDTITTPGTRQISIPSNAINPTIEALVLIGGGGAGGTGGKYLHNSPPSNDGGDGGDTFLTDGTNTFTATGGKGGKSGYWGNQTTEAPGGGGGGGSGGILFVNNASLIAGSMITITVGAGGVPNTGHSSATGYGGAGGTPNGYSGGDGGNGEVGNTNNPMSGGGGGGGGLGGDGQRGYDISNNYASGGAGILTYGGAGGAGGGGGRMYSEPRTNPGLPGSLYGGGGGGSGGWGDYNRDERYGGAGANGYAYYKISYLLPGKVSYVPRVIENTFTSAGVFQIPIPVNAINVKLESLILGGAGGGGGGGGGGDRDDYPSGGEGGGGGGSGATVVINNQSLQSGVIYELVVGAGGDGGTGGNTSNNPTIPSTPGQKGGDTMLRLNNTPVYVAPGGQGGQGGPTASIGRSTWGGAGGVPNGVTGDPCQYYSSGYYSGGGNGGAGRVAGGTGGTSGGGAPPGVGTVNPSLYGGGGGGGGAGWYPSGNNLPGGNGGRGADGYAYYKITYLEVIS